MRLVSGASTPLRTARPALPLFLQWTLRVSPTDGSRPSDLPTRGQLTAPTAHLVVGRGPLSWVLTHGTSVAVRPTARSSGPGTARVPCSWLCLHPGPHAAGRPWAGALVGFGFSGTRPAGRPWEGHTPPALHPAWWSARTGWGQEAPGCLGPRVKLPPGLRPASPQIPPVLGSLLVKQLVGQENLGVWATWDPPDRGPRRLGGRGRAQQGGPSPLPQLQWGGRTASAQRRQQLVQTSGPGHEVAAPCPLAAAERPLPASSWVKWPVGPLAHAAPCR